jgi:hypothetical protein
VPRKSSRHRLVVYLTVAQRDALLKACERAQGWVGIDTELATNQQRQALDNAAQALRSAQPMTLKGGT